ATQHQRPARIPREIHRRLPGGICAADDVNVFALACHRLGHCRAVINSTALQAFRSRHVELSVGHARRKQKYFATEFTSVCQLHHARGAFYANGLSLLGREDFDAKALGLRYGSSPTALAMWRTSASLSAVSTSNHR